MPRVAVSYGPPGHKGVDTMMGLGADAYAPDPTQQMLEKAAWISVAAWGAGVLFGKKWLRDAGLGGAAASFGVRYLAGRDLAK